MRRVDCVGTGFLPISVDADKIVYCESYETNSGEQRLAIYFSTDPGASPLTVRRLPTTLDDLLPISSVSETKP